MPTKMYVTYAVKWDTLEVTTAEYDLVHTLYNKEQPAKITAIRFIRSQYGIGLKQAKDLCDTIGANARVEIAADESTQDEPSGWKPEKAYF